MPCHADRCTPRDLRRDDRAGMPDMMASSRESANSSVADLRHHDVSPISSFRPALFSNTLPRFQPASYAAARFLP